jgi:dolichol-phosphate mannosyltransferase
VAKLLGNAMSDGWASSVVLVTFLSGINIFMTGIVGLYVGAIHAEVKRRPLYIVARHTGLETASQADEHRRAAAI